MGTINSFWQWQPLKTRTEPTWTILLDTAGTCQQHIKLISHGGTSKISSFSIQSLIAMARYLDMLQIFKAFFFRQIIKISVKITNPDTWKLRVGGECRCKECDWHIFQPLSHLQPKPFSHFYLHITDLVKMLVHGYTDALSVGCGTSTLLGQFETLSKQAISVFISISIYLNNNLKDYVLKRVKRADMLLDVVWSDDLKGVLFLCCAICYYLLPTHRWLGIVLLDSLITQYVCWDS